MAMSCMRAAIVKPAAGPCNGKLFTEEDWNNESSLTDGPYRFSKVRAGTPYRMRIICAFMVPCL